MASTGASGGSAAQLAATSVAACADPCPGPLPRPDPAAAHSAVRRAVPPPQGALQRSQGLNRHCTSVQSNALKGLASLGELQAARKPSNPAAVLS